MRSLRDLMSMEGRVVLVTGGAGAIGYALCEALAELGSAVAMVDVAEEACAARAEELRSRYGVQTMPLCVDVASEQRLRVMATEVLDHFGQLDVLVNCAALVGTSNLKGWITEFGAQRTDVWRSALEVNLTAPFLLAQLFHDALRSSGHGAIVNIGSTYGIVGPQMHIYEDTGLGSPAAYAASKGGLLQLTRWLATVLAPEVRVNAISPGGVVRSQPTAFQQRYVGSTPMGRMATEEDLKGAIAYLASDLSAYVTGHNLVVDGGWTAW